MVTLTRLALFLVVGSAFGQAPTGTVSFTPPSPGKLAVSAGAVVCSLTGNTVPATAVSIACAVGSVAIPAYTIPLSAGSAYTFDHRLNGDAVTVALTADSAGRITYDATATPNGGQAGSGRGSF